MKERKKVLLWLLIVAVLLAACIAVDAALPSYHIAITVIKKATVYALVAVSMNLLNGFTGLFSLGQAGFMLLGAYSYAILTIPVAKRAGVYQYFDGGWIQFSLPEIFSGALGDTVGSVVGMLLALLVGGLLAALVACLIGLPVLRLKSDYLAIATLGFAEILVRLEIDFVVVEQAAYVAHHHVRAHRAGQRHDFAVAELFKHLFDGLFEGQVLFFAELHTICSFAM